MIEKVLLDTDILSEILKGIDRTVVQNSRQYCRDHSRFTLSVIAVTEITNGYAQKQKFELLDQFFETVVSQNEVLNLTSSSAKITGEILAKLKQSGTPVGAYDPLVAVIAIENNLPLITGNTSHFKYIQDAGFPLITGNWRTESLQQ